MSTTDVNISILLDGSVIIPRGTDKENKIITQLFDSIGHSSNITSFFNLNQDSEDILKSKNPLCG